MGDDLLFGTGEWRIIHDGSRLWPYHVINPTGSLVAIRQTMWTAKRALCKAKASADGDKWWNRPTLYSEAP